MDEVRRLLGDTDQPLKVIAAHTGYSSLNTFSKVFKRRFGMSATEYRTSVRQTTPTPNRTPKRTSPPKKHRKRPLSKPHLTGGFPII